MLNNESTSIKWICIDAILYETSQLFTFSVLVWFNVKQKPKQMNLQRKFSLTCDRQLGSPPDHKVPKLQLARVIPNVIFSYFLDGQSVPPPLYRLPPLLWLAFLDLNEQKDTKHAVANVKKLSGHWRLLMF